GENADEALAEVWEGAQARYEGLTEAYHVFDSDLDNEEDYASMPNFAASEKAALEENLNAEPFTSTI
ncbi:MAG: hypothetical protein II675_00775, partial [Bacteroidaceae bacterium]|nr:hypothetical protein [Bacteroidaceae bacterium]